MCIYSIAARTYSIIKADHNSINTCVAQRTNRVRVNGRHNEIEVIEEMYFLEGQHEDKLPELPLCKRRVAQIARPRRAFYAFSEAASLPPTAAANGPSCDSNCAVEKNTALGIKLHFIDRRPNRFFEEFSFPPEYSSHFVLLCGEAAHRSCCAHMSLIVKLHRQDF